MRRSRRRRNTPDLVNLATLTSMLNIDVRSKTIVTPLAVGHVDAVGNRISRCESEGQT